MTSTETLIAERGKTHGDFSVHAGCTQALKNVIRAWQNHKSPGDQLSAPQQEAVDMIMHKIGRIVAGDANFRDHWDDIAGYAKLVSLRCSK